MGTKKKNSVSKKKRSHIGIEIVRFVMQLESLFKAVEPTMTASKESFDKVGVSFKKFLDTRGRKRRDAKKGIYFQIHATDLSHLKKFRKDLTSSALAMYYLPILFHVSLVSQFDAYLRRLLLAILSQRPELLNSSQKTIAYSDLSVHNSLEEMRAFVIEKEIDTVLRDNHPDQFEWMESRFGLTLRKDLSSWPAFVELTERRNLFVHCDGVITKQYLEVCRKHNVQIPDGLKIGDTLSVSKDYFGQSYRCILEIGVKLGHVLWRKLFPDQLEDADDRLNDVCFDLLSTESYELAENLLTFATSTLKKHSSDIIRRVFVINLAIANKWQGKENVCQQILKDEDWTACEDRFQLAIAVLQNRFKDAAKIMVAIGPDGKLSIEDYSEWPLFRDFRKYPEFLKAYKRVFRKEFTLEEKPTGSAELIAKQVRMQLTAT
ncbi:MAG: hypothetical protein ABSB78_07560 [Bacteroidota bacterium]